MARPSEPAREADAMLPLSPIDLQILLVLTQGDVHGYGLMKAVEEQSGGKVRLEVGSLYRVIKRLLGNGLIEETRHGASDSNEKTSGRGPKPRRFYQVSEFGREVAVAEAGRLSEVLETARAQALIGGKKL